MYITAKTDRHRYPRRNPNHNNITHSRKHSSHSNRTRSNQNCNAMRYRKGLRSEIRKQNPLTHHERVHKQVIVLERIESWRRINPILVTFAQLQRRHHRGQPAEHHIVENLHSLSTPLFPPQKKRKKEKSTKNERRARKFSKFFPVRLDVFRLYVYAHSHTLECASVCKSSYAALPVLWEWIAIYIL